MQAEPAMLGTHDLLPLEGELQCHRHADQRDESETPRRSRTLFLFPPMFAHDERFTEPVVDPTVP